MSNNHEISCDQLIKSPFYDSDKVNFTIKSKSGNNISGQFERSNILLRGKYNPLNAIARLFGCVMNIEMQKDGKTITFAVPKENCLTFFRNNIKGFQNKDLASSTIKSLINTVMENNEIRAQKRTLPPPEKSREALKSAIIQSIKERAGNSPEIETEITQKFKELEDALSDPLKPQEILCGKFGGQFLNSQERKNMIALIHWMIIEKNPGRAGQRQAKTIRVHLERASEILQIARRD